MALPWAKISQIYTCGGSICAGAYIYYLIPKGEGSNVSEVLDRAGFTGIEKASVSDLKKLVAAYKRAAELEKEDFKEKIEGVDLEATDDVIAEQLIGGCRSLTLGEKVTTQNKDTARRFCVVTESVQKTLEGQGFKFLDFSLDNHNKDDKWQANAKKLLASEFAPPELKALADNKEQLVIAMKSSCSDVAGAPTTSRLYKKFVEVARGYCGE